MNNDAPLPPPPGAVDYDPFADGALARVVPTTEPQRELWLADRLGPDASLAFNESVRLQLRGRLAPTALRAALQGLLDRHDALRAGFGPDGETLCVLEGVELTLDERDLSALDPQARAAAVDTRLRHAVDTPFSLEHDRLFRAELLRLGPDEHLLILTAHHIVCDGWSWWVLVQELGALYAQCLGETAKPLPPAEDFADYALAELAHPAGGGSADDEAYWLARFAGEVPVLDLPIDRPRPARRSFASAREDHVLDAALVAAVRALGARRGVSLFATLLASFAALLARLGNQSRVVVGIPAAGQALDGHDHLVGHCVNTLPLLFEIDLAQPVARALDDAQATLLDALEHQRYTFGTLLRKLRIGRDPARLPLISVMFNIDQALDHESAALPGLELDFATNPRSHENFELFINAVQAHGELRLECQYNTALFDTTTIKRWLGYWRTMLEAMVADDAQALGTLPLLAETERRQVLEKFNDTHADFTHVAGIPLGASHDGWRDGCLHALIEAQVTRTPQAIALVHAGAALSYAELNARANRLARHLRALGVRPDDRVAICAERSIEMVVGLLAILKAGGAYVPLDPTYPADRLAYMLGDSRPGVVLTQARLVGLLGEPDPARPLLLLDAPEPAWARLPDDNLDDGGLTAGHLAYIIYTSGSTGMPKGAMNEHRGVVNRLLWMQDAYALGADDTVLQKTPFSFDVSVWEFFWPLMTGARLVMARPDGHKDPAYLADCIRRERITTLHFVPSMLQLFLEQIAIEQIALEHGDLAACASLRRVVCSGEALPAALAARFHERLPEVALHNLYGPTEAAVDVTAWACVPGDASTSVPIGRPIANTRMYILDPFGQPVPPGVAGELFIGGVKVGRGYFDRAELTAERFLPDPFVRETVAREQPARMYRTGDLGRWRADGSIDYLGRNDFQVKLRGFRIELGEIEKALEAHPTVAQAVVVAREERPGDLRLVGYVVARPGATCVSATLATHLLARLPEYMVPAQFVALAAIPLSPNGKIDRRALPAPDPSMDAVATDHVAPRDALEQAIATAMAHALGRGEIGIHDGFFDLGGHSLLAAQVCARLTRVLGVEVPLRSLFDAPSVARLAELLRERADAPTSPDAAAWSVPRRDDQTRAPMSLMQQRLWVLEQIEPGGVTWNTPSAHRLRGELDVVALERAFQEVLRRQPSLRTCFVADGDGAVQQVHAQVEASLLPLEDFSAPPAEAREQALRARIEGLIAMPFELDRAPLFRAQLFRLDAHDHVLFFMVHHIVWDGWSFDLFYEEMAALYAAFSAGRASPLPELEVSYGDFAAWHLQRLSGDELQRQLAYWKRQLDGALEPLDLPTDFPRPLQMSGGGSTQWIRFDGGLAAALRAIGARADATLFMTLLAAYVVLLHRWTGQRDLIVGVPVRNRGTEALERIMGCFVNMLPLRLSIDPTMPFVEVVRAVRERVVESFSYPDVPFEHLVRELRVSRDPSRPPLYQALFSFQDVRQRPTHWGALQHERFPVFQPGTSNDIGLWFVENAQGLVGGLSYNTDILAAGTAALWHERFAALLEAVCAEPMVAVGDVDLSGARERAALAAWNDTAAEFPVEPTLHALLQAQAMRTPDRVALRCGEATLCYADLDARAQRIAQALRRRGVGAGDLVGVCLERGPDLVATLIGVLKTGAAYVPLDPAYPAERLRYIANDAALAQVVSAGALAQPLAGSRQRLLLLDADGAELDAAALDAADPELLATADDVDALAYVIYTSGSTGQPKGVRIPHRAVLNFLASMRREPGLDADDRLLAVTTTSFDIAVLEMFLPLSVGAEVVLASREQALDGYALVALLEASTATVMQATPSTWRMLFEAGWRGAPRLRALVGGEALPAALAAQLCASCAAVWNLYGPTETTVWSTCCKVERPEAGISIGHPIANTTVQVRDARGQPCPIGVPGELWIGGAGVALGYHQRPELDAERFVADPGSIIPGARLYHTGDRGRWRADGTLEHLGRLDFQVKVRGHRIELGEIEARLAADPAVASAVALAREDRPGDVRLVGYVVARPGLRIDVAGLRAQLQAGLPDYMVPQHILVLEALPLLPNGKLDRKALPAPALASAASTAAPATEADPDPRVRYLVQVWSELLGTAAAPADNFFELGGHSMLAVQMANRVACDTGARIRLVRLATQSLAQVAAELPATEVVPGPAQSAGGMFRGIKRLLGIAAVEDQTRA